MNLRTAIETPFFLFVSLIFCLYLVDEEWISAIFLLACFCSVASLHLALKYQVMIWIMGIPTIFIVPNNILKNVPILTVDRVLFMAFVLILLIDIAFRKKAFKFTSEEKTILVFLVSMFLSFLLTVGDKTFSIMRLDIAMYIQGYAMPLLTYFIARRIDWTQKDIFPMLWLFSFIGFLLGMIGLLQHFFNVSVFTPKYFEVIHTDRATGTFANATEYGVVLVTFFLLTLFLFTRSARNDKKLILIIFGLFQIAGILVSKTRAPWLAAVVVSGYVFLIDKRTRIPFSLMLGVSFLSLPVVLPMLMKSGFIGERVMEMSPIYNRLALYATAVNMTVHNPILGVGFGRYAFIDAKREYLTSFGNISAFWAKDVGVPHNEFLHIAVLGGLVSLFIFILILYRLFKNANAVGLCSKDSDIRMLARYITGILICMVLIAFFVELAFFNYFVILVFFLTGFIHRLDQESLIKYNSNEV